MSFPDFWQSVRTTFRIGLPVAAVLTCMLLALSFVPSLTRPLSLIEQYLIDYRMAQTWDRLPAEYPSIVIVTISEDDLVDYQDWVPTPRDFLARVVAAVDEMSPRAIGLDYFFVSAQTPARDKQLLTALRQAKAAMVIGAVQNSDVFTQRQLEFQKSFVAASGRQAGFLSVARDADHVVRVVSSSDPGRWPTESFSALLATAGGARNIPPSFRVAWLRAPDKLHGAFSTITARALLAALPKHGPEWAALAQSVKDRIVLVGGAFFALDQQDTALSVITKSRERGVIIQAHMIAQLLDGRYFAEAGPMLLFGLPLSRSLLGFFAGVRSRSRLAILIAVTGGAVGLLILDARMLDISRTVIPITLLVLAWVLTFAVGAWFARSGARVAA